MIEVRQGIRRLAKMVNPDACRAAAQTDTPKSGGGPAAPPAGEGSDAAPATQDAERRQVLASWWIVRLASDKPEDEITERAAARWRLASESAEPRAQRWRQLADAVESAIAETAGRSARFAAQRGMVAEDRAAVALILGGHDVAEVASLEQISVRDVHRRLRTGLTSLGSILRPTSSEDDNPDHTKITLPQADLRNDTLPPPDI